MAAPLIVHQANKTNQAGGPGGKQKQLTGMEVLNKQVK